MPSTRHISGTIASRSTPQTFSFPPDRHLLITTPRHVFSWDATGVHTIFSSSRGGIVSAKEAKDGSGILAIASSSVVVIHDTRRGKEESWGLNAPQDGVRHIEYAPDAKTLYLTTSSDGTVQRYSTDSSRLLEPVQKHHDAPIALAVSSTGHLLLSASQRPPVIYVKNTAHNTASIQVQPNASSQQVSCAAFHPERPNIFLLAFQDGVVAIYDATKLSRPDKDAYHRQQGAEDGEISRLQGAHRAVMSGDVQGPGIAPPIAGAAFLPGFKSRVVTAGRDGRCKLIDFSRGGEVLRTWHAKAPLTSLGVLATKSDADTRARNKSVGQTMRTRSSGLHTLGGPTSTSSIVAVSRIDGIVQLHDSVGLLIAQTTVSSQEENILSLEWAKGLSPEPCNHYDATRRFSEEFPLDLVERTATTLATSVKETGLGLPPTLRYDKSHPSRQFTLHPDEADVDTVRYTPSSQPNQSEVPTGAEYHDLFSPVKPAACPSKVPHQRQLSSPPKSRPRLSSQTFMANPDQQNDTLLVDSQRHSRKTPPSQNESASPGQVSVKQIGQLCQASRVRTPGRASTQVSPGANTRRQTVHTDGSNGSMNSVRKRRINTNAQVLADIRKLSTGISLTKHGALSSYARSQTHHKSKQKQVAINEQQTRKPIKEVDVADSTTWPTDSASISAEVSDNDIWLTSDSEDDRNQHRRRRMQPANRPPARQTSRSRMVSTGTIGTVSEMQQRTVDGSANEQMFAVAPQRYPIRTFSPRSERVREMFPRTSSLSPRQKRSVRKARQTSQIKGNMALTSMAVNVAMSQQSKTPWARLKDGKGARPMEGYEDPPLTSEGLSGGLPGGLPRSGSMTCLTCPETRARVQGLETEVAHLKGEVLALKAILRRNGLPFSGGLR